MRNVRTAHAKQAATSLPQEVVGLCTRIGSEYDFEPIQKFGRLKRRADGFTNARLAGLGTNTPEGANKVAKVIQRVAFGFKDSECFALKLKVLFLNRSAEVPTPERRP